MMTKYTIEDNRTQIGRMKYNVYIKDNVILSSQRRKTSNIIFTDDRITIQNLTLIPLEAPITQLLTSIFRVIWNRVKYKWYVMRGYVKP